MNLEVFTLYFFNTHTDILNILPHIGEKDVIYCADNKL